MATLALDRPVFKTVTLNVLLCAGVVAIPSLSHATALPLYRFEPMRLLLFVAILTTNRRNALLMALWLPLLSFLTSGHPIFPKFVLIQGDLVATPWVYQLATFSFILLTGILICRSSGWRRARVR